MKEEISLTLASYIMGWEVQREAGASEAGEEGVGAGLQLHRVEKPTQLPWSCYYTSHPKPQAAGVKLQLGAETGFSPQDPGKLSLAVWRQLKGPGICPG